MISDTLQVSVSAPCTLPRLNTLLDTLYATSQISNKGLYESLREKLVKAQKELDKNKPGKAADKVWEFAEAVDKQLGKQLATAVVATLRESAFCVLGELGKDASALRQIEGLRHAVAADYQQGLITRDSLRRKLDEQLADAQAALVDKQGGDDDDHDGSASAAEEAIESLQDFIAQVKKEQGKRIQAAAADELAAQAQIIVDDLTAGQ